MLMLASRRFVEAIVAMLLLSMIVFVASRLIGNPLDLLLGPSATLEDYARLERELGLDRPLPVQFVRFIQDLLQGDLGTSLRSGTPVTEMIVQRLPASLILAFTSVAITLLLGVPLGIISAVKRGTTIDAAITTSAVVFQSVPAFWLGILMIGWFAVGLGWFPAGQNQGLASLVLPAVTLGLYGLGSVVRLTRTSMLNVLDAEYIRFAYGTGLRSGRVVFSHALRNALLPVISFMGIYLATLVTLNAVVESVFDWPGLGSMVFDAIRARDYPVVQGLLLFVASIVILINFLLDVLYTYIDPRIRYDSAKAG